MKKLISLLLIAILLFSSVGCNIAPEEPKTNESKSSSSSSPSTTATKEPEKVLPEKPEDPRAEPIKALEYYIATNDISEELKYLNASSNTIKYVLAFDTSLEPADFIVYNFLQDDIYMGSCVLDVSEKRQPTPDSNIEYAEAEVTVSNDGSLFRRFNFYYKTYAEDFKLFGIVYPDVFYAPRMLFGKYDIGGPLYAIYYTKPEGFKMTARDVCSIEDYKLARQEYSKTVEEIKAAVPKYAFSDSQLDYKEDDGWLDPNNSTAGTIFSYEYVVPCPVISENDSYEGYIIHLLYSRDTLIGEALVAKRKDAEGENPIMIYPYIWEKYGADDGSTIQKGEFTDSLYLKTIEDFKTANPDTEIKGLSFDGENFRVIPME